MSEEIKIIRRLIIITAGSLLLVFYFFSFYLNTKPFALFKYLVAQVGSAVGIQIKVPENPYNTLAQQLREKEISLEEREKILTRRESIIMGTVFGFMIFLFLLLILNFYFDWRHRRLSKATRI